jgi:hypothetical protein
MNTESPDILIAVQMPKERKKMNVRKVLVLMICVLFVVSGFAQMSKMPMGKFQQSPRGKAELKAEAGSITIDYGRPELKGRDMLAQLKPGDAWRMGNNSATVLKTPVDLSFGSTKIAKGDYSLFLKLVEPGKFELVFNSQTGQWGLQHDVSKDVASVPMKLEKLSPSVELFTIELKEAPGGGIIALTWGENLITTQFKIAK